MSTLHRIRYCVILISVLPMLSGCFFALKREPTTVPVYLNGTVERTLPVTLYYDLAQIRKQKGGQPAGLIVYSVGYSACTPSAASIANMFSERGYVVAVPHHNDLLTVCLCIPEFTGANDGVESGPPSFDGSNALSNSVHEKAFSADQLEEFFYYRSADIASTIDAFTLSDDNEFGSLKNKPIILVGYSLGGWSALNVAGAGSLYPELQRDVSAVVCQNTFVGELSEARLQAVSCPVFYLAGTEDSLYPYIRRLYDWRPRNSRMVEIVGADHYIFAADLCSSPVLSAMYPGTCGESTIDTAKRAGELTVDFVATLTETHEVPRIEELER